MENGQGVYWMNQSLRHKYVLYPGLAYSLGIPVNQYKIAINWKSTPHTYQMMKVFQKPTPSAVYHAYQKNTNFSIMHLVFQLRGRGRGRVQCVEEWQKFHLHSTYASIWYYVRWWLWASTRKLSSVASASDNTIVFAKVMSIEPMRLTSFCGDTILGIWRSSQWVVEYFYDIVKVFEIIQ